MVMNLFLVSRTETKYLNNTMDSHSGSSVFLSTQRYSMRWYHHLGVLLTNNFSRIARKSNKGSLGKNTNHFAQPLTSHHQAKLTVKPSTYSTFGSLNSTSEADGNRASFRPISNNIGRRSKWGSFGATQPALDRTELDEVGNNEEIYNVHNEGNKLWNFCNFVIVLEREYISITKQIYHLLTFMVEKRTNGLRHFIQELGEAPGHWGFLTLIEEYLADQTTMDGSHLFCCEFLLHDTKTTMAIHCVTFIGHKIWNIFLAERNYCRLT